MRGNLSITINVARGGWGELGGAEGRGVGRGNPAGLHTGSRSALCYWVMAHFSHFELGKNSPLHAFLATKWANIRIKCKANVLCHLLKYPESSPFKCFVCQHK